MNTTMYTTQERHLFDTQQDTAQVQVNQQLHPPSAFLPSTVTNQAVAVGINSAEENDCDSINSQDSDHEPG